MYDRPETPDSDAALSGDGPPISPMTKEKERRGHAHRVAELEQKLEFSILATFIQRQDASPENAVKEIVQITRGTEDEQMGTHCWETACCLLELAARTTPDQQHKLVALVRQLRATTLINPVTNEPLQHDGSVVWKDLPTFGYTLGDELGAFNGRDTEYTSEEILRWEHLISFVAQLDASSADFDFSQSYALTAFTWAFEDVELTRPTEVSIRLACRWFIYDAGKLWAKVLDGGVEDFSLESWKGWKQGLVDSRVRFVDDKTQKLIDGALAEIKRVEASK